MYAFRKGGQAKTPLGPQTIVDPTIEVRDMQRNPSIDSAAPEEKGSEEREIKSRSRSDTTVQSSLVRARKINILQAYWKVNVKLGV